MVEHFTCVSEPGSSYLTHVTPTDATGREIASELVAVIRERNIKLEVMGMDGCSVNTGIHRGVIRVTEQELNMVVQHIICLLHLNELPFRHELCAVDGVTSGPGKLFAQYKNIVRSLQSRVGFFFPGKITTIITITPTKKMQLCTQAKTLLVLTIFLLIQSRSKYTSYFGIFYSNIIYHI